MVAKYLSLIEAEIKKEKFGKNPTSLYEPLRYIMALGGKRLRPLLTVLSYSLYKKNAHEIVPFAAAVEVFHNFTLLHDDIMDQAPLRRGKRTVHEKWGTNTAILSGDVMLVKVYDMLLTIEGSKLKEVLRTFNQCAAAVCEGQQLDMEFETRRKVSEAGYIQMIKLKTAVLLGFSLEFGAMLAGAPIEDQRALRDFGINIGIGFQLKDDWLDVFADEKKFGKRIGGDIIANKKTFLLIKALEKTKGKQRKELTSWINAKTFSKRKKVKAITSIYENLGVSEMAEQKISYFFARGFACLDKLQNKKEKEILIQFVKGLMDRAA